MLVVLKDQIQNKLGLKPENAKTMAQGDTS